jgi:hypothetical protein
MSRLRDVETMVAGVLAGLFRLDLCGGRGARMNRGPQMGGDDDPVRQDSQNDDRHQGYQTRAESFRKLCCHGIASINDGSQGLWRSPVDMRCFLSDDGATLSHFRGR